VNDIIDAYLEAALWTTDPDPGCGEYCADLDSIPEAVKVDARLAVLTFLEMVPEAEDEDRSALPSSYRPAL
jgi:hypothetical protein